jgi:hypothetical protein
VYNGGYSSIDAIINPTTRWRSTMSSGPFGGNCFIMVRRRRGGGGGRGGIATVRPAFFLGGCCGGGRLKLRRFLHMLVY